ncbi:cytochrome P450 family protein [Ceratobasidium sp. AG-Ba]|nr:cytochrome P450 family protein [Ceratobasidium sp. AG-Ba]
MELISMTLWQRYAACILIAWSTIWVVMRVYNLYFHPLKRIPGPALPAATSLWIRWQRWQGKLSFTADDLLAVYGPVIRIAPNMVLVNDPTAVSAAFAKQNLDTAPTAIRALRVGGHDWTVTYPQMDIARPRRRPVMMATTTRHLKYWLPLFETYLGDMISNIMRADGEKSVDIVHELRMTTLYISQVILGGASVRLNGEDFPQVVGEYNFLVVWRLVFPEWMINWLRYGPSSKARYRIKSSDLLYKLGEELYKQAEATSGPMDEEEAPSVYQLFTQSEKGERVQWTHSEISAEMAGQLLAATETTSSTIAFIMYELAKNPGLVERLYSELQTVLGNNELDTLKLLDATIKEGLRFRPPVALTGSRTVGKGGMELLGYFVPEGTVLTTQALSICRQRPDLFPNADVFDPGRWLEVEYLDERRKLLVPFGVGTRRCPGGNLAIYQMRLIIGGLIRNFKIAVAPETTPKSMAPFEANGFRSRYDQCHLIFTPRNKAQVEFEK